MQPLHIFEPRYRRLLEDALAGDRLITMALLAPGWEKDYDGRPAVHPIACLGRITTYHQLEDGTYNLLLLGVQRVRVLRELVPTKPYREAVVELCNDICPASETPAQGLVRCKLREAFLRALPMLPEAREQMDQLLASDVPLGVLTDVIGFMLDIDVVKKEALLAERNVYHRAELLVEHLSATANGLAVGKCGGTPFPPQFSVN
jgi:Lon protease-like protein